MAYDTDAKLATIITDVTALGATTRLGSIAGIDRGEIACSTTNGGTATATIGAVVMARTIDTYSCRNGHSYASANSPSAALTADGQLTNTTTVTATTGTVVSTDVVTTPYLSYTVVEYSA